MNPSNTIISTYLKITTNTPLKIKTDPPPRFATTTHLKSVCPYWNKVSDVVKISHMITITESLQRYKCKAGNKIFSDRPLKYVTYPQKIILTDILIYNPFLVKALQVNRHYRIHQAEVYL